MWNMLTTMMIVVSIHVMSMYTQGWRNHLLNVVDLFTTAGFILVLGTLGDFATVCVLLPDINTRLYPGNVCRSKHRIMFDTMMVMMAAGYFIFRILKRTMKFPPLTDVMRYAMPLGLA